MDWISSYFHSTFIPIAHLPKTHLIVSSKTFLIDLQVVHFKEGGFPPKFCINFLFHIRTKCVAHPKLSNFATPTILGNMWAHGNFVVSYQKLPIDLISLRPFFFEHTVSSRSTCNLWSSIKVRSHVSRLLHLGYGFYGFCFMTTVLSSKLDDDIS
jgi:hypothetical protein